MRQSTVDGKPVPALLVAVASACAASSALAFGLGHAFGTQYLGSPLHAEVPLSSAEELTPNCVAVVPVGGEELYFPLGTTASIEGHKAARRLVVVSRAPIREPLVVFQVRAGCESPIARDYTLLTEAPRSEVLLPTLAPAVVDSSSSAAADPVAELAVRRPERMADAVTPPPPRPRKLKAPRRPQPAPVAAVSSDPEPTPKLAKRDDHLAVGAASSQMKMLSDAIIRLEQSHAAREKIQGELVGAISGAVVGIVELREQMRAQELELKRLRLQIEQEQRARASESRQTPNVYWLMALVVTSGLVGAGLMLLHHHLKLRASPASSTWPPPTPAEGTVEMPPSVPAAEPAAESVGDFVVMPPMKIVKAPQPEPEGAQMSKASALSAAPGVPPNPEPKEVPDPAGQQGKGGGGNTDGGKYSNGLDAQVDSRRVEPLAADLRLPGDPPKTKPAPAGPQINFDLGELKKPADQ